MKKIFILLLTVHWSLVTVHCFSQDQRKIDSLQTLLNAAKQDTNRVKILNRLAYACVGNEPYKAMDYAKQALELSEQIDFKKGVRTAYRIMGIINKDLGNYAAALDFYNRSLKISDAIGDKIGLSGTYQDIGVVYDFQGNYPEALKFYFAALRPMEETGDKKGMAGTYNNIGTTYLHQGNYPEALKYFLASLKIYQELRDNYGTAVCNNNIGNIYLDQNNYPEALKSFSAALKIFEEIGNKQGIVASFMNIGIIYIKQGKYADALKELFATLKISEEIGDKIRISDSYINIADVYAKQKKFHDASQYLNKALLISKESGSLESMKYCYKSLAELDSARGNFQQAWEYYKLYVAARDSLVNEENTRKTVQQQMQYEFDKKEAETKAVTDAELKKQKLARNGFIGGTVIFLLLAAAIFVGFRRAATARKKSDELLLNILPAEVASELKQTGHCQAKTFSMVTVMFMDFKDFTRVSESVSAELLVDEINTCFSAFDGIIQKYKVEKIKTVGDSYICAGGLPVLNQTHAKDVLNAAIEIREFMIARKKDKDAKEEFAFEMRIGIHTGPVVAGIVGVKKFQYDIWGDTVNLAARIEQNSEAGKINISGSTYKLVKEKFTCVYRGKIEAKNKGEVEMYFVEV